LGADQGADDNAGGEPDPGGGHDIAGAVMGDGGGAECQHHARERRADRDMDDVRADDAGCGECNGERRDDQQAAANTEQPAEKTGGGTGESIKQQIREE
jgi:hypothetical protein